MNKKAWLNVSQVVHNHRLGLWILLLVLTALILLFPVQLRYEYHAIESVYVFGDKLPLFGILFYVWLIILLLLLFTKSRNNEWQRVALVCLFSLVFFGFWAINTPNGGHWDELWQMAHIKYLQETGNIVALPPNLGYFSFPGFHLLAFSITEISGLDILTTRTIFILFSSVLFAGLSYLLFMKLLKDSYLSSLAVLLIVASLVETRAFWPGNPGVLFLILILALLAWHEDRRLRMGISMTLILIILLAAFTITYAPAPVGFIFILVGIYLLQSIAKKGVVVLSAIALFVVMFLAWEMYYATAFFPGMVGFIPAFVAGFMNPMERWFSGSSLLVAPAFGEVVPLWAKSTKVLLLALTIGFGAILGIWKLLKARKLSSLEVLETGGLLGVIVFLIVCFLATPGTDQGFRALTYLPFFTIPIMVSFLSRFSARGELSPQNTPLENSGGGSKSLASHGDWFRKDALTLLIILFFVLSFPAFLLDQPAVSSAAVYPYETSAGEFIESACDDEELNLFSEVYTTTAYIYYSREAHFHNVPPAGSEEELITGMNELIDSFQDSGDGDAIFILSERFRQPAHQPVIVDATDPRWVEIMNRLAENNKIYNNGHTEIYER